MFDFLQNLDYLDSRNNEDYYHFGFIEVPRPNWEEILQEFDKKYKIYLNTEFKQIIIHQSKLGFVLGQCETIPIVKTFLDVISTSHNIREKQTFTALGYISLSSESKTHGRHRDVMDVWCWQMTGYTFWEVEGKKRKFEKVLEPGELIYVPRGMWHNTKPITPRASISFGSEDKSHFNQF